MYFLETLKNAAIKARKWAAQLDKIFPGVREGLHLNLHERLDNSIGKITERILVHLCDRIKIVDQLSDRPSRLEAMALRVLLRDLTSPFLSAPQPRSREPSLDKALIPFVLRKVQDENDFGIALGLRNRLLADSPQADQSLMTDYAALLRNLRQALQPLLRNLGCHELMPPEPHSCILFDDSHWTTRPGAEGFWRTQDYLGSSAVHLQLEKLCDQHQVEDRPSELPHGFLKCLPVLHLWQSVDSYGRTILHIAAQCNCLGVVEAATGLDANARTKTGSTALHFAAALGHLEVCRALLQRGAEVNARDYLDRTPLHYAAIQDRCKVVEFLLKIPGLFVNARDEIGQTPFMRAIDGGSGAAATGTCYRLFLVPHARVDYGLVDNQNRTVLHLAARKLPTSEQVMIFKDLIAVCPLLVNQKDMSDETALSIIARVQPRAESYQIARLLLRVDGVDAGLQDRMGMTALHYAARQGNMELCRLLGMRVDGGLLARCNGGFTPRQYAIHHDHLEVADMLKGFEDKTRAYGLRPMLVG